MTADTPRTCKACDHRAGHGNCREPARAGLWQHFIIIWPPAGYGANCKAWTPRQPLPHWRRPKPEAQTGAAV